MRIRFFNTYEPVTSLYRDLVPLLTDRGAEVEIVVSRGQYRRNRDLRDAFGGNPRVKLVRTIHFGLHAYQGWAPKLAVTGAYLAQASLHALVGRRVDQNVFLTQPPFFPLLGSLLRIVRRQPYHVVLMDIQPDLSVALGLIGARRALTRLGSWSTRASLRRAEGVIVIGRCMANYVRRLGVAAERIRLIPNWADEREVFPVERQRNRLRFEQGWQDKFVVAYAGNLGLPQHFDDILEVAAELGDRPDIAFAFIGEGVRGEWLENQVAERGLKNVTLLPFLHERMPLSDILSAGDVQLVSLKEACTGIAVPSKTYGAWAAGRPVLFQGSPECEIARTIHEEKAGKVVACGDPVGLRDAILHYWRNPAAVEEDGLRGRQLIEGKLGRRRSLRLYLDCLLGPGARPKPKEAAPTR